MIRENDVVGMRVSSQLYIFPPASFLFSRTRQYVPPRTVYKTPGSKQLVYNTGLVLCTSQTHYSPIFRPHFTQSPSVTNGSLQKTEDMY